MSEMRSFSIELDELPPDLAAAYAYWKNLTCNTIAPSWEQFDLFRLPPIILPTTAVCDIEKELGSSTFRFWGSRLSAVQGQDMTGRRMDELMPLNHRENIIAAHERVVRERQPNASCHGQRELGGIKKAQLVLRLPLSSDGETVDKTVICVDYSDWARKMIGSSRSEYLDVLEHSKRN